jgi:hypothetical protein
MVSSRRAGVTATVVALLMTLVAGVTLTAAPANALPPSGGCYPYCEEPDPDPTPPVTVTAISSMSPDYGWSGDAVTLSGTGFTNATVTVNNLAATVTSRSSTRLAITLPELHSDVVGHQTVPLTVSSPTGTVTRDFVLSPSLRVTGFQAFDNYMDGTARATVDVNRQAGTVTGEISIENTQSFGSLSVNTSVVWLDKDNVVIGYTPPQNVTVKGVFYAWPSDRSVVTVPFISTSVGPNPGRATAIHSGRVVFVRDHAAEMASTLSNAYQFGQSIATVITKLSGYMG